MARLQLSAVEGEGGDKGSHLQFTCPFPAKGLQWKAQVVCFCQGSQIKIILGINTGGNIDVELQQFKKLAFQLVPAMKQQQKG